MLARHHALLALPFLVPAFLFGACTVKETDTDIPIDTTADTTSTTTGDGGSGGEGGTGGAGGAGGAGGGASCVDDVGTGETLVVCDELNVAPMNGATQCAPDEPVGYRTCKRGFGIFAAGHAENLVDCLATIGVQDACVVPPVEACIEEMYAEACASAAIAAACDAMSTQCGGLDVPACSSKMNPFSEVGVQETVDCINASDPMLTCQEAFDACYPQVMSF